MIRVRERWVELDGVSAVSDKVDSRAEQMTSEKAVESTASSEAVSMSHWKCQSAE